MIVRFQDEKNNYTPKLIDPFQDEKNSSALTIKGEKYPNDV